MARSATLDVKILVDAAQATAGLSATASKFQSFATNTIKLFAGAFAVDKIVDGIKSVVTSAADLEQVMGGVDKVFGESAKQIHAWAADQDDSIRLSQREWERAATGIGAALRATGAPMSEVADQTKNLMQISADFAATFGRDIGETAQAVRAALTGEYEALQNMGVAISGATVQAEALKIAQGDQALAATDAVKAQAAYNVIVQQGALYAGQAEAESKSFTAQLDDLKAKLDDAAGAAGGPLLAALGSLVDSLSGAVPLLGAVATALAGMVAWVLQLPAPLQSAALAMAAFALAAHAGWISAAIAGFRELVLMAQLSRIAFVEAGGGLRGLGAAAGFALSPLKSLAMTLGAGLIIGGIVAAITAVIGEFQRLDKLSDDAKASLQGVTDALVESGGAWNSAAADAQSAALLQSDAFKSLVKDGFSAAQAIDILKGSTEGLMLLQLDTEKGLNGLSQGSFDAAQAFITQRDATTGLAAEQRNLTAQQEKGAEILGQTEQKTESAEDATKRLTAALKEEQEGFQRLADSTDATRMLDDWNTAQENSSRAAEIFNAHMDKIFNRRISDQRTVLEWNDGLRDTAEAFKAVSEAGAANHQALVDWDTGALAATESGSKLASQLLDQSQVYGTLIAETYSATKASKGHEEAVAEAGRVADTAYAQFTSMATSMGLSSDEAAALATKLGIVDAQHIDNKIFDIIAKDEEARRTAKLWETVTFNPKTLKFETDLPSAQSIADDLNSRYGTVKPDPVKLTTEIGEPKAVGAFGRYLVGGDLAPKGPTVTVGTAIQPPANVPAGPVGAAVSTGAEVTGGTVTVQVQAGTTAAQQAITALVTQSRTLTIQVAANTAPAQAGIQAVVGGTYQTTVRILGDTVPVNNGIRAVIGGTYSTTVRINGDTVPVNNALRAVIGGDYSTTVRIGGDNSGAISAIRAITTGSYSATVRIGGDASGFYSVWNSLPTSRTITVTVNQVQGSVVAPPAGRLAPAPANAAPSLMAAANAMTRATTAAPIGATTNITIEAGLGDPDAIARAVKRVLLARDRRSGGVVAGEMRVRVGHS